MHKRMQSEMMNTYFATNSCLNFNRISVEFVLVTYLTIHNRNVNDVYTLFKFTDHNPTNFDYLLHRKSTNAKF